jgi:hypothetical protein
MAFTHLRLKWKFSVAFRIVVLLVTVMCVTVMSRVSTLTSVMTAQDHQIGTRHTATTTLADLVEQQDATGRYAATGGESFVEKIKGSGGAARRGAAAT